METSQEQRRLSVDAKERAEKIWENFADRAGSGLASWDKEIRTECVEWIVAQISEAEREACSGRFSYRQGWNAAREKAAKIANEAPCTCGVWSSVMASDIAKMEPDSHPGGGE